VTDQVEATYHETPLHDRHVALGARLIEFGGWLMPVQYSGILEEHRAVRERAGLFDLSHMGELFVEGPDSGPALAAALVSNPPALAVGRAQYSMICAEDGGIIDDLIVYRLAEDRFLVVANASNAHVVSDALVERLAGFKAVLDDRSLATALCAVQGPRSVDIVGPITDIDLGALRYYAIAEGHVASIPALVARTGYTGEDGFEIFVDNDGAAALWQALVAVADDGELTPAGLASRDSLRLEAGMPLYGNELSLEGDPFAAGLGPVVALSKEGDFVGKAALAAKKAAGAGATTGRRLVGLKGLGRRAGRGHYPVLKDGVVVGEVTSGQPSPSLGYPVAMAYVDVEFTGPGTALDIDLRGKTEAFEVVALPFYKRAK
jgi:aminomethyltransferase